MIKEEIALTTIDNPYNPLTQFEEWYKYDTVVLHYHSCELLDRVSYTSPKLSDAEYRLELEKAIDKIIESPFLNPLNVYKKIVMNVEEFDDKLVNESNEQTKTV